MSITLAKSPPWQGRVEVTMRLREISMLLCIPTCAAMPCQAFMADMKVRVLAHQKDVFYYPNLVVGCDERDTDDYFLRFPKLIIEVMSESTERLDRLEKFSLYTTFQPWKNMC